MLLRPRLQERSPADKTTALSLGDRLTEGLVSKAILGIPDRICAKQLHKHVEAYMASTPALAPEAVLLDRTLVQQLRMNSLLVASEKGSATTPVCRRHGPHLTSAAAAGCLAECSASAIKALPSRQCTLPSSRLVASDLGSCFSSLAAACLRSSAACSMGQLGIGSALLVTMVSRHSTPEPVLLA